MGYRGDFRYPVYSPQHRGKSFNVVAVLAIALVLFIIALLGVGGRLPTLTIVTNSTTTNSDLGVSETSVTNVLSTVSSALTKLVSGLVVFIGSGTKLEVLTKGAVTALVFFGLAYITNLVRYLLYGLAVFSILTSILVVLGVI